MPDNVITSTAAALHHAVLMGLAHREVRDEATDTIRAFPLVAADCQVFVFPQTWPSTALGFDRPGEQQPTTAYTVVVKGPAGDACIYFAGALAYNLATTNESFDEAVRQQRLLPANQAGQHYLAEAPPSTAGAGAPAD